MKVGVDLRGLEGGFKAHKGRGLGRYAEELWNSLLEIDTKGIELHQISSSSLRLRDWQYNLIRSLPAGRRTIESQFFLPMSIRKQKFDLVHYIAHVDSPSFYSDRYIVTLHDLIPLRFEDLYKPGKGVRFKFARYLEKLAALHAARVIVVSEATKHDLVQIYNYPEHLIDVVYNGISSGIFELSKLRHESFQKGEVSESPTISKLGIPATSSIALYWGGIDARKNVTFLFDVLREARNQGQDLHLVLVGNFSADANYKVFKSALALSGLEKYIHEVGFVADTELGKLLLRSNLVLFPSLYEGFGLPVGEALAAGIPVVCQSNSSLIEVGEGAASFVKTFRPQEWAEAIAKILSAQGQDEKLSPLELSHRVSRFSWQNTAKSTLESYRKALI